MTDRLLDWPGCQNARDFGGMRTRDGNVIRHGAIARSGALDRISEGYVTVIDLRNEVERPDGLSSLHMPLDGTEDREFWNVWEQRPEFGTPYYYRPFLDRFPGRAAQVVQAIATAPPGGVVFHCQGGRDRTGLISILLLSALGVEPAEIAADYALSTREPELDRVYERRGTTPEQAVLDLLEEIDVHEHIEGVDVDALRARAVEP